MFQSLTEDEMMNYRLLCLKLLPHFDLLMLRPKNSLGFKAALQVLGFKADRSNAIMCIYFSLQLA